MLKGWGLSSLWKFCRLPQSESPTGVEMCSFHMLCLATG